MDFTDTVICALEQKNEYMHGDVLFSRADGGSVCVFIRKRTSHGICWPESAEKREKKRNCRTSGRNASPAARLFCRIRTPFIHISLPRETDSCVHALLDCCGKIQERYDASAAHITRMFGSYVLLRKADGG
jgi:hypothetical protein